MISNFEFKFEFVMSSLNEQVINKPWTSLKHVTNKSLSSYEQAKLAYAYALSAYCLLWSTVHNKLAVAQLDLKTAIVGG